MEYVKVPDPVVAELRGIGGLVESDTPSEPLPAGRLFAQVRRVAAGPESAIGVWIRQIDLVNPVGGGAW